MRLLFFFMCTNIKILFAMIREKMCLAYVATLIGVYRITSYKINIWLKVEAVECIKNIYISEIHRWLHRCPRTTFLCIAILRKWKFVMCTKYINQWKFLFYLNKTVLLKGKFKVKRIASPNPWTGCARPIIFWMSTSITLRSTWN